MMPVPIPGSELHASASRSTQRHRRLADDDEGDCIIVDNSPQFGVHSEDHDFNEPYLEKKDKDLCVDVTEEEVGDGLEKDALPTARHVREYNRTKKGGVVGLFWRTMGFLVKHGVEERGIQPVPEDERVELRWWTVIPQVTLWAAANTNILTFSTGTLGPALFGLDLNSSVWTIVVFNCLAAIPVAYFATFGPLLGMRQMVQSRYSFGYYPALLPAACNCLTMLGFIALNCILGGQTLALVSGSTLSWDVGIVIVGIISLALSFLGLRALHFYSMGVFTVIIILYLVIIGVTGDKLHLAREVSKEITVSAGQILGFGATMIGFTIPYASLASDFTTYLPRRTNRVTLFFMVWFGLVIPICCIMVFGAAAQLAAQAYEPWTEPSTVGVANLLYAMTGSGKAAKFVMFLLFVSVTGNTAPTIYSCGLSSIIVFPFLVKVPRYFLAVGVTAIYIPVAIAAATNFYTALENFLVVLSYWTAMYIPISMIEPLIIRRPSSTSTFPLNIFNDRKRLPVGYAAILAMVCGVPIITAGMAQSWWTGWIAKKIPVGGGDIGFELGFLVTAVVYLPARILERRWTGK